MKSLKIISLVLILMNPMISYSQEWIRTFDISRTVIPYQVKETYDHGILIGAAIDYVGIYKIGWIIKTDINGIVLWEKQLGNGSHMWLLQGLDTTKDGGIIISGRCDTLGQHFDPFLMKLNPCGEIEWCRFFHTANKADYGMKVKSLADGSYLMLIHEYNLTGYTDISVQLNHVDNSGNLIWEQKYFEQDSLGYAYTEKDLSVIQQNKYLITGTCYHALSGQSGPYWVWPMLILADSSGESVFELPFGYDNPFPEMIDGEGYQSIQINGTIFSSICHYQMVASGYSPALIKTTVEGNEVSYKDLVNNTPYGKASTLTKFNDSTLFIGIWYQKQNLQTSLSVIKTDTVGIIKKEKILNNSEYIPSDATFTHDKKYLIAAQECANYCIFHLWKLNENLEWDSIYTQPHVYDSLCPYPLTTSTLYSPCDIIESVVEPAWNTERVKLHIYPNPASSILHIEMPECIQKESKTAHLNVSTIFHQWTKDLHLEIHDLFGRLVYEKDVNKQETRISVDVSAWSSGLYTIRLVYGDTTVAVEKVVVE